MKTKRLSLLLASFMSIVALTSCGPKKVEPETPPEEEHTHTYSSEWESNDEYHWHPATCGHDVKGDYGKHVIENYVCTICGKEFENPNKDEPFDLSGKTVKHTIVEEGYLIHARFPGNDNGVMGKEYDGMGVNWQEDVSAVADITSDKSTYARFVITAPFTGTYPISLQGKHFNQTYPFRVYANSKTVGEGIDVSISDPSYSWADEERSTATFNISLNKGKNVVLVQVFNWGYAYGLTLPEELGIIRAKGNKSHEYTQDDFVFQAAYLADDVNVLDPDAQMIYKGLKSDGDAGFEGAAILHFQPDSTTKSLDITYKIEEKNDNAAGLTLRLGNSTSSNVTIDVSSSEINQEKVCHIPSYSLAELGFNSSAKQCIHVASTTGKLQILGVKESSKEDQTSEKVLNPTQIREKTLVRGRNILDNNYIGLDWTSSGIEFDITGGGDIFANMEEVNNAYGSKNIANVAGGTRFAIEIDGEFKGYVIPSSNMELAKNLSASKHHVAIYKTSEAAGGLVNLKSLKFTNDVTITKTEKSYNFEILGDSITCGNQISSTEENGYLAYTTQLTNSWNANLNAVSVSGRGLKLGYNCEEGWPASWNNQVKDLWTQTSFFRDKGTSKWNTANYTPDVVICNLGNNDLGEWVMSIAPMTITQFTDEVKSFSSILRTAYPNAKIIWCYGAFVNRSYENEYRTAVNSLNDANMEFVYFDKMGGGADDHPNAAQHQTIANVLSAKIASMLGVSDPRA